MTNFWKLGSLSNRRIREEGKKIYCIEEIFLKHHVPPIQHFCTAKSRYRKGAVQRSRAKQREAKQSKRSWQQC